MNFIKHTNELLNESYYIGTHKSGLEVVVIPKDQMTLSKLMDQMLNEGSISQTVYDKICWDNAAKNLGFQTVAELSK